LVGATATAAAPTPAPTPTPITMLRAPVHFVEERRADAPRFSAPFFMRAPPGAELAPGLTNETFLGALAQRPWARLRVDQDARTYCSDF